MSNLASFIVVLLLLVAVAFGIHQYLNPKVVEVVVSHDVVVPLSPKTLDSLKLSFYAEFKGTIKPKIIKVADSAQIKPLLNEIFALKDSLKGKAKLELTYFNDNQPPYGDTLGAKADFISDSMSVVFRPKQREYQVTIRDTLLVPVRDGFWDTIEKVGYFSAGALLRGLFK